MSMFDTDSTLTSPKRYRSVSQYSMQDTMVSSSPNISSNTSKSKRKDTLDQSIEINTEVITNQIKKCRIYCTPGELRYSDY